MCKLFLINQTDLKRCVNYLAMPQHYRGMAMPQVVRSWLRALFNTPPSADSYIENARNCRHAKPTNEYTRALDDKTRIALA